MLNTAQPLAHSKISCTFATENGVLAHLARARHWQCRGERFESAVLHRRRLAEFQQACFLCSTPCYSKGPALRASAVRLPPATGFRFAPPRVTHKGQRSALLLRGGAAACTGFRLASPRVTHKGQRSALLLRWLCAFATLLVVEAERLSVVRRCRSAERWRL